MYYHVMFISAAMLKQVGKKKIYPYFLFIFIFVCVLFPSILVGKC